MNTWHHRRSTHHFSILSIEPLFLIEGHEKPKHGGKIFCLQWINFAHLKRIVIWFFFEAFGSEEMLNWWIYYPFSSFYFKLKLIKKEFWDIRSQFDLNSSQCNISKLIGTNSNLYRYLCFLIQHLLTSISMRRTFIN